MNLAVAETTISLRRSSPISEVELDNLRAELAVLYGVPLGSIRLHLSAAPPRSTRRLGDLGVSSGDMVVITVDILTSGNGGGAQGFLAVSERVAQATARARVRVRVRVRVPRRGALGSRAARRRFAAGGGAALRRRRMLPSGTP